MEIPSTSVSNKVDLWRWLSVAAEAFFKVGRREKALEYLDAARNLGFPEDRAASLLQQWESQS